MARVSSHSLRKDAEVKLFTELARIIAKAENKNASAFLQTLLTPTEQVMLAKRIGVIALFHTGVSTYQVMQKLHMSSSTVMRMHHEYKSGAYESVTKLLGKNKTDWIRIMTILEIVLRGGLPRRAGKRWTLLDTIDGRTAQYRGQ